MNLVQVQERLKEVPIQAVMAYANGMNPDVPPYLALGELNRRKRMEQEAATGQPPQGTVKEQIEASMGGIAGVMPQGMPQQMPQQMPQGMPPAMPQQMMQRPQMPPQQPVRMARGGLATLPVRDDVVMYGSGGIVAFAEGDLVEDSDPMTGMSRADLSQSVGAGEARLTPEEEARDRRIEAFKRSHPEIMANPELRAGFESNPERFIQMYTERTGQIKQFQQNPMYANMTPEEQAMIQRDIAQRGNVKPTISPNWMQPRAQAPQVAQPPAQPMARPVAQPAAQPAAQQDVIAQLQKIYQTAAPGQATMTDMLRNQATAKPPTLQELMAQRAEAAKAMPYLNKQPGEELEKYLAQMAGRSGEERQRFEEMEKERTRAALWKSLMAAGEASRGQRGIGALLGGFGRTAAAELEAGRGREAEFMKAERERELAIVKMKQEIENARIAQANGDYKGYQEAMEKARAAQQKAIEKGADVEQRDREAGQRVQAESILRGIPQAKEPTLQEQLVEAVMKGDTKRAEAIRQTLTLGSAGRNQLTLEDALKMAREEMKDPIAFLGREAQAAKNEKRQPRTYEQAINQRAQEIMRMSTEGIGALPQQTGSPREGQEATSSSGKPIVFRNGRWEYK